ncbi:unnamed protein product [Phytophthora fragariaefolia]|uniref:Unnamed protein product n=1 Tax=Phytophthora fragariaefolia TaxID=1490495 RepID=A0A9W6TM75_9STRA|nr:unnamed protein product [Phytophthora fragariaefolia]
MDEQRAQTAPTAATALSSMIRAHSQPVLPPHATPTAVFAREESSSIKYDEMWSHSFALKTNQRHDFPTTNNEKHDKNKKKSAKLVLLQTDDDILAEQTTEQLNRIASSELDMCIKHLGLCKNLQTLYVDNNKIKDIEGIAELKKMWRIDITANLLTDLHALASFRALGFLYLEGNRICFEDLVCIRDVHLLEVRLLGNHALFRQNTVNDYRKKVAATLPNTWILDGHFISATERQQAIEECDEFVTSLLKSCKKLEAGGSKFGSVSDVWIESEGASNETLNCAANLIQVAHKALPLEESPDLRRLKAIVSFHNAESKLHNAHRHFAPSRHARNARLMPKVWVQEILALPRRIRLEVIILIATFIEFRYPKILLSEALTIRLLDSRHFPPEAIQDTVNLPPYALVAIVAIARQFSIQEEQSMRESFTLEAATDQFQEDSKMFATIPPLFETLLDVRVPSISSALDSNVLASSTRSRQAIKLLANTASFPDPAIKGKGKREAIVREMMPLIRAAKLEPASPALSSGCEVVVPYFRILSPTKSPSSDHNSKKVCKRTMNAIGSEKSITLPEDISEVPPHDKDFDRAVVARRKPKPGDWVEICQKQFVKIQFLSADGLFVVAALPTDASRTMTISLEQMFRVSNTVWRVKHLNEQQSQALFSRSQHPWKDLATANSTRIGKLHRDSDAFHRHGAARNQGFPNHFVTSQVLKDLDRSRDSYASHLKSIEIFSSNDTLDANYVLSSPEHISAQNHCAMTSFDEQCRTPMGLWSPVKQQAPYSVLGGGSLEQSSSLKELKTRKPRAAHALPPQQPDDWLEIRQEMQAQLGILDPTEQFTGTAGRPMTGCSSHSSDSDLLTRTDVSAIPTVAPDPDVSAAAQTIERGPKCSDQDPIVNGDRRRLQTLPQKLASAKFASTRVWHQVTTKTEFVFPSSGYANLISHLKDKHPDYGLEYKLHQSRQAGPLSAHGFVNPAAANMCRWMEWVVDRNMSLCEVDNPLTRAISKLKPTCSKKLKRYVAATVVGAAMHRQIEDLHEDLKILKSVTSKLQAEDLSLADVRTLFDAVVQRFPSMKPQLKAPDSIVHSPAFESAAVKVINGDVRLSTDERAAIKAFEKAASITGSKRKELDDDSVLGEDFATAILRAKKTAVAFPSAAVYSELLMKLPPTSNRVERLFSQAKLILTPQRASLLPINMELLIFLRSNRRYWDMETVNAVYQQM